MPYDDIHKAIAQIIATAWADTTNKFQNDLMAAKNRAEMDAVLERHDLTLPEFDDFAEDGQIHFVANTDKVRYVVIPERPKFTDEDMGLIIKLRQDCTKDCSCTLFCGAAKQHVVDTIVHRVFGKE